MAAERQPSHIAPRAGDTRSLWGHTALALLACALAYVTWQRQNAPAGDHATGPVIIAGSLNALQSVTWHDPQTQLTLHRAADAWQITLQKANGKAEIYPASKPAEQLLNQLAPLHATRNLGPQDANKLAALGLQNPNRTLTLQFKDQPITVQIGNSSYGGDQYLAQISPNPDVYLLPASILSGMVNGGLGLLDREALPAAQQTFDRLVITDANHHVLEYTQQHPEDPAQRYLAASAQPEKKLEQATQWARRLFSLRVMETQPDEANASLTSQPPSLDITLWHKNQQVSQLKLWRQANQRVIASAPRFPQPVVLARGLAEALLGDVEGLTKEYNPAPAP